MRNILCPFCFTKFNISQALFRCINVRCSGRAEDHVYAKYQALLTIPVMEPVFLPSASGLKAIANRLAPPRETKCPYCERDTGKRVCPNCHFELMHDAGKNKERIIAIIGGRNTGKSVYIATLINALRNEVGANFDASLSMIGDNTRKRYEEDFYNPIYRDRKVPQATQTAAVDSQTKTPMVFRLTVDVENPKAINLVVFDSAGEDMTNIDTMSAEAKYICYSDAIIFLLDPLQIEAVRQKSESINLPPLLSDAQPKQIVERLRELHERQFRMKATDKIEKPVAFTLSKIDILSSIIDPSSALHHGGEHFGQLNLSDVQSVDTEISSYLESWIGVDFNNFVRGYFKNHKFFGFSSLGMSPISGYLEMVSPLRVEDPLLWILHQFGIIKGRK